MAVLGENLGVMTDTARTFVSGTKPQQPINQQPYTASMDRPASLGHLIIKTSQAISQSYIN